MAPALGQGGEQPILQETSAHRGDRAVDRGEQRTVAFAFTQSPRQLEAAARHVVDLQNVIADVRLQAADMPNVGLQHLLHIKQQRPGRGEADLRIVEAEAGEGGDAEVLAERRPCRLRIEVPVRPRRQAWRVREALQNGGDGVGLRFRADAFRGAEPGQLLVQPGGGHIHREELAGRDIEPRQPRRARRARPNRGEVIVRLRIEQIVLGDCPRRDDARHLTLDQPLGLRRILNLIAHRDAQALLQQLV